MGRYIASPVVGLFFANDYKCRSRSGVPYYCVHCCMFKEILPIELRGYPIRINFPGERPEDPCIQFFYKRPELIPEEYFARVGKTKTVK